jgi:FSR family fosmidomycin resistance protein-like MFS transporter
MESLRAERSAEGANGAFWTLPLLVILLSHIVIDAYSNIVPTCLGVIEKHWRLEPQQAAWLLGMGSLASGLSQPVAAWVSDRLNSRLSCVVGLLLGAIGICWIGSAGAAASLFAMYAIGQMGIGVYHPVAVATIGQLNSARRSAAISCFYVAGMAGVLIGATLGPAILARAGGLEILRWLAIPGFALALVTHRAIGRIDHRNRSAGDARIVLKTTRSERWGTIGILYFASAMRFGVNMAIVYLLVRWVEHNVAASSTALSPEEIARLAAPQVGLLNGAMVLGMASGGLLAGMTIGAGREKWPLVVIPILLAPFVALIPTALPRATYVCCFFAGAGFASLVPVTLALTQRLLPHRTGLASALMLGGAWALAMFGPRIAHRIAETSGIATAFGWTAVALAVSGAMSLPIRPSVVRTTGSTPGPSEALAASD